MAFQAKWIEGKTISKVRTLVIEPREYSRRQETVIQGILFTDGSQLTLYAAESDWDPVVLPLYRPAKRKGKTP